MQTTRKMIDRYAFYAGLMGAVEGASWAHHHHLHHLYLKFSLFSSLQSLSLHLLFFHSQSLLFNFNLLSSLLFWL
jgi:hypothetical protein